MSASTITLPNLYIKNIKADLVKGQVDITFQGRLTLEFMKLRPQLTEIAMNDKPCEVDVTPPPSLFDELQMAAQKQQPSDTALDIPS